MKSIIAILLILNLQLCGQDIVFSDLTDMENGKSAINSSNDGEHIYIANGFSMLEAFTTDVIKYDIALDTWTTLINSTIPKRYANSVVIDGKLYILNGIIPSGEINNEVEVINLTDNSYSLSTINPTPGRAAGISVWEGKIYSFGGGLTKDQYSNKISVFDPANGNWTILSNMPIGLETKGEIVNGNLYVFGGFNGNVSDRIDKYDIATNTWSFIGLMPIGISAHATSVIENKIWLVGDYTKQSSLAYFDVIDETFHVVSSNMNARRHAATEGVNGKLYVIGGNTTSNIDSAIPSIQVAGNLTSNENVSLENSFSIYPNPVSEYLFFEIELDELKVFDIKGQLMKVKNESGRKIDLKDLELGTYILLGSKASNYYRVKFQKI